MSRRLPSRPGRWRRCWWALLPLAGLLELGGVQHCASRAPRLGAYRQLAAAVAGFKRPGELVVTAPAWAGPMVRQSLGDAMMPLGAVARPTAEIFHSAVEVSLLSSHDAELADWRPAEMRAVGPFVLRRLVNPAPQPSVFDFVARLGPTAATVSTSAGQACRWLDHAPLASGGLGGHPTFPRRRFQCRGGSYFNVGATVIADERFAPRRCLWAHPPARGELRITFGRVPLGSVLVGHGGMYWMVERERSGAPVELAVRVDGDEVGRYIHADGDGWSAFALPLGHHVGAAAATVQFAVSSPDYRRRHFCFEARTR